MMTIHRYGIVERGTWIVTVNVEDVIGPDGKPSTQTTKSSTFTPDPNGPPTIVNVVVIDDEAVGFDDERGKWEPFGIKEAEERGWVYLAPEGAKPPAWLGDEATVDKTTPPVPAPDATPVDGKVPTVAAWTFELAAADDTAAPLEATPATHVIQP